MKKENWLGVDIKEEIYDEWIKELAENENEYFRLSGNRLVVKEGARIYICKLEQIVDLPVEKHFVRARNEEKIKITDKDFNKITLTKARNEGKTKELMESVERLAKLSEDTNTPIWTASQKQNICTRCGLAIDDLCPIVSDRDGKGNRFAHYDCYFPKKQENFCKKCGSKEHSFCVTEAGGLRISTIDAFGEMTGDCVAQCLNCVWNGWEGYKCICGDPSMSMDSDRIRREKENGKVSRQRKRQRKMKCSGCRAGLPLGSGRYHYDKGDVTVPCTHDPNTGVPYWDIPENIILDGYSLTKEENYGVVVQRTDLNPRKKCECGGTKTNTTHSLWCPTQEK